ncbi:MFS transporter [candidate division KSB1 bacterium]
MNKKKIALLSLSHFSVDTYHSFLRPILPLLMIKLGTSVFYGAVLAAVLDIVSSFSQPLFGYFSDKLKKPLFIVTGPLLSGIFISLLGIAGNYTMALIFIVIGGIGIAAFHPQGAASVGLNSGNKKERGIAVFLTMGTFGYSFGPALVVLLISFGGLSGLLPAAVPGIILTFFILKYIKSEDVEIKKRVSFKSAIKNVKGVLTIILFVVTLRAVLIMSYTTFIPMLIVERGGSENLVGIPLFFMHFFGTIGGLFGAYIAEKTGSKMVIILSFFIPVPFLYYYLFTAGIQSVIILSTGTFILSLSIPVTISFAQKILPSHIATVSSFLMGFCWGVAGLILIPLGALAEKFGIQLILQILALITITGGIASFFIKDNRRNYA